MNEEPEKAERRRFVNITDSSGECNHKFEEEYYGWRCQVCDQFIPFGLEPWLPDEE